MRAATIILLLSVCAVSCHTHKVQQEHSAASVDSVAGSRVLSLERSTAALAWSFISAADSVKVTKIDGSIVVFYAPRAKSNAEAVAATETETIANDSTAVVRQNEENAAEEAATEPAVPPPWVWWTLGLLLTAAIALLRTKNL